MIFASKLGVVRVLFPPYVPHDRELADAFEDGHWLLELDAQLDVRVCGHERKSQSSHDRAHRGSAEVDS